MHLHIGAIEASCTVPGKVAQMVLVSCIKRDTASFGLITLNIDDERNVHAIESLLRFIVVYGRKHTGTINYQ